MHEMTISHRHFRLCFAFDCKIWLCSKFAQFLHLKWGLRRVHDALPQVFHPTHKHHPTSGPPSAKTLPRVHLWHFSRSMSANKAGTRTPTHNPATSSGGLPSGHHLPQRSALPGSFTAEDLAQIVRTQVCAALEDEDSVARLAVLLQPHFSGFMKRPRGRPSTTRPGDDFEESAAAIAAGKIEVGDVMEKKTVRCGLWASVFSFVRHVIALALLISQRTPCSFFPTLQHFIALPTLPADLRRRNTPPCSQNAKSTPALCDPIWRIE